VFRTLSAPSEVARLTLPTPFGERQVGALEWADSVHLWLYRGVLIAGDVTH
jgi:hypothetical protein